ncbi:fluoride efflux transporter CrcB [Anoxybacillus flavithermus]|uniref:fluoride efflux transporter CrcB n=1 Tax=Anoxybacillus flavithermus TaxID=33934 RepID=UPI0018671C95|nr:fluoride efflux transporter CrcB [Anoxybacillus flavithermus]MBE2940940.1 fluoride efflux transporter CrcB [Anoxybacillus flavithermus]MBE2943621.1 fluoride efflux transporter CrcB [Anoxybacillus flavithermus]MBE2951914.1 fluoride efflux transporter CrcB [Anoxybacillus flavithermus]MBE2954522.1 fluoride efflux transporter CrcB [Anoxybacillus flavithermus]MBE2959938.1 fluoride efflux transporter CrcB [Anoxybacillus flavithermus]
MMYVALGGALGAWCRYKLGIWLMRWTKQSPVPLSILFINWIGSFGLGIALVYDVQSVGVTVGFFGAFTTFSTFSVEALQLLLGKQYKEAFLYISASIIGSICLFQAGFML